MNSAVITFTTSHKCRITKCYNVFKSVTTDVGVKVNTMDTISVTLSHKLAAVLYRGGAGGVTSGVGWGRVERLLLLVFELV